MDSKVSIPDLSVRNVVYQHRVCVHAHTHSHTHTNAHVNKKTQLDRVESAHNSGGRGRGWRIERPCQPELYTKTVSKEPGGLPSMCNALKVQFLAKDQKGKGSLCQREEKALNSTLRGSKDHCADKQILQRWLRSFVNVCLCKTRVSQCNPG